MKKISLFCIVSFVLSVGITFSYSNEDISNAQYLANNSIVKNQKSPELYRLDDFVLRQEVIGMALKIQGITLPENYTCKKYFTDVTGNGWECRAIEIAADIGMISRENTRARPLDTVTRAEALAILLKTGKVSLSDPRRVTQADGTVWSLYQDLKGLGFTQWQSDMLDSLPGCSLINHGDTCEDGASTNQAFAQFRPNSFALRSSVFEFAALMMGFQASDDIGTLLDDFGILVNTVLPKLPTENSNILSPDAIKALLVGEPIQTNVKFPQVALVVFSDLECPFCVRYFQDVISPLLSENTLSIAVIYKHFPLSFHPNAYTWALESECIRKNLGDSAYFDYISQRYYSQESSVFDLSADFTQTQMDACLSDADLANNITSDQKLGNTYKVAGTPTTLVINMQTGYYQTIEGSYPKETVEKTIDTVQAQ